MKLRELKESDAPYMLEWMHDERVTCNFKKNFSEMTIENCEAFIKSSQNFDSDAHYAVVNDEDEYMGTVSLKNIDTEEGMAEFAITMRTKAQGHGYARFAFKDIMRIAFDEFHLSMVYWDVLKANVHAIHFYQKQGGIMLDIPTEYMLSKTGIGGTGEESMYYWFIMKSMK